MRDKRFVTHSAVGHAELPVLLAGRRQPDPEPVVARQRDRSEGRALRPRAGRRGWRCWRLALFRRQRRFAPLARPETGLLLACAIDYPVWLYTFGIHRYMVPLEILCGAVVLVLADWLATGRWRARLLLVLVILTLARVHVGSWQRLPWQDHWRTIAAEPLALPGKPLIFLTFAAQRFPGAEPAAAGALRRSYLRRNQSVRTRDDPDPAAPGRAGCRAAIYALRGDTGGKSAADHGPHRVRLASRRAMPAHRRGRAGVPGLRRSTRSVMARAEATAPAAESGYGVISGARTTDSRRHHSPVSLRGAKQSPA